MLFDNLINGKELNILMNSNFPNEKASIIYSKLKNEMIMKNDEVDFWVSELDGKFLGGIIVLKYNGWLYYWSGMINREDSSMCINNGLLHEALKFYTNKQKFKYFNFGPSEHLGAVKKFKESWGTEFFVHHHYVWQSKSYRWLLNPLQKLKGKITG